MGKRGRPTKSRSSELGQYIEGLRHEHGWTIHRLASEAGVSLKTLSKLELASTAPRRTGILFGIAKAFGVDPDRLLIRAGLTTTLRPTALQAPKPPLKKPLNFLVDDNERRQLEDYLQFLRYMASVEALCQRAEAEAELPD